MVKFLNQLYFLTCVSPCLAKGNRKHPGMPITSVNLIINVLLQFNGCTPSACWNQIYKRIKKMEKDASEASVAEGGVERGYESGSDMFGFSNPKVAKLIQVCYLTIS